SDFFVDLYSKIKFTSPLNFTGSLIEISAILLVRESSLSRAKRFSTVNLNLIQNPIKPLRIILKF
ncbi:MAG: hypothetical protein WKF91_11260, partial [Segetibacter sp.]